MLGASRHVVADWQRLLQSRLDAAIRCWDHVASTPIEPIGGRYTPLKGDLACCTFRGTRLRQWQWEIDRRARVQIAIGNDFVVIVDVSTGHPKGNE